MTRVLCCLQRSLLAYSKVDDDPSFLLGIVVIECLELLPLDVKTTFLHGDLNEEIYMEQPKAMHHLAINISYVDYGRACTN
jgi:hypothetical protein